MREELYYNSETGEIATATDAIHDFYQTHGGLETWKDSWTFFGMSDKPLEIENLTAKFAGAVRI